VFDGHYPISIVQGLFSLLTVQLFISWSDHKLLSLTLHILYNYPSGQHWNTSANFPNYL